MLSLYYSTDRVLLYTNLLKEMSRFASSRVWSFAVREDNFPLDNLNAAAFEEFKGADAIPEWLNWVRRFNDYVWDDKGLSYSRQSIWRLIKSADSGRKQRLLRRAAQLTNRVKKDANADSLVEGLILKYGYCNKSLLALDQKRPAAVIAMVPFSPLQMSTVAAAKKLGIPVAAYITSWDNLTTKTRLTTDYDAYMVWSDAMKNELLQFHPHAKNKPVCIVGAPQYDVFMNSRFYVAKEEFLASHSLRRDKRTVLYCLGSPNFIKEDYSVLEFLNAIDTRLSKEIQVIVRLHPGFYESDYKIIPQIKQKFENVIVQGNRKYFDKIPLQPEESIIEWVNTFRHVDVVINLASTVTVDACIFDKPVINLNYDSEPGGPNMQLIKEINENWNHFSPIAKSGGVWNVNSTDELLTALRGYLDDPSLHREGRQRIVEHVCGSVDGGSGARMAEAVEELVMRLVEKTPADNVFRPMNSAPNGHAV